MTSRFARLFLVTISCTIICVSLPVSAADKPNIVLIMADDIGIEGFGCYGGTSYQTPRIDDIAARGLRFTHAYSQPLCTPTRVQLMTGRYNHRNWKYFGILDPEAKTFGHRLQDVGYRTLITGKWQLQSYDPPDFPNAERRRDTGMKITAAGFDEWSQYHAWHTEDKGSRYPDPKLDINGTIATFDGRYGPDQWVAYIANFLQRQSDSGGDQPFFIYHAMALPHWPFNPTPESEAWKDPSRRYEESTEFFSDMVAYMDKVVGQIFDHLDRLELSDNTLVLFYGDNGTDRRITSKMGDLEIPGGKALPLQSGIRVPLVAYWPGKVPAGTTCSDLVNAADFVPTLMDLAGVEITTSEQLDGQSFAPQLLGRTHPSPRDNSFFWYDPRPGWDKMAYGRSVFALDKNHKLFRDGRLFEIDDLTPLETELKPPYSAAAKAARKKLRAVIDAQLAHGEPPLVDAFGDPVE
jgi:arylsulfatase A-like enzyme